jgi:hypothetical protein
MEILVNLVETSNHDRIFSLSLDYKGKEKDVQKIEAQNGCATTQNRGKKRANQQQQK